MVKKRLYSGSDRECPVCKQMFTPVWYQHKYCSEQCINKANYLKYRDRQLDRNYVLQKVYGISEEDYKYLFKKQNGVCAICKEPETHVHKKTNLVCNLSVDHDHNTDKVRGLLCTKCNKALGLLKDNIDYLNSAIKYLESHITELKKVKEQN